MNRLAREFGLCGIIVSSLFSCKDELPNIPEGINIPDENFKSYLIGESAINTNRNDVIEVTEAEAYEGSLLISNMEIASLEGIQHFPNIRSLQAFRNNLTSVDLSANTMLLQVLLETNELETLDVSMLPLLTDLKAHSNQLTSVNMANGKNENFTRVEFQGNPNLTCIQVDNLEVPSSGWLKDNEAGYSTDCTN